MSAPFHGLPSWAGYARKRGLPVEDEEDARMQAEGMMPAGPEPISMAPMMPTSMPPMRPGAPMMTEETLRKFSEMATRRKGKK